MSNIWSNDEILKFLECYQAEPCIWDPGNGDHKDSLKKNDAWQRISLITKKNIPDMKAKKESLMGAFRKHLKKKNESIRSGAGADDIYKPIWFAYDFMESFLLPIYSCKTELNSETQSRTPEPNDEQTMDIENNSNPANPSPSAETPGSEKKKLSDNKRRRNTPDNSVAEQQMATAFGQLTNALTLQSRQPPKDKDDECNLYAKLLAIKLRELPKDERKVMMYEIDGLFINKTNHKSFYRDTPSPQYSSRSSSSASNYIIKRPRKTSCTYPEQFAQSNLIKHRPSPPPPFSSPVDYLNQPNYSNQSSTIDNFTISVESTDNYNRDNPSSSINILSDEIISSSHTTHNIINEAYMKAYEDFESEQQ